MTENPRRGRQARNFTTNVPKILGLKSSSEQIFFRKLSLGAPITLERLSNTFTSNGKREFVTHDQVSSLLVVYYSLFLHQHE